MSEAARAEPPDSRDRDRGRGRRTLAAPPYARTHTERSCTPERGVVHARRSLQSAERERWPRPASPVA